MPTRWMIAGLLGIGLAALAGIATYTGGPPAATGSGEVGQLEVFGQIPFGPIPIAPDALQRLPRPQYLAFQFSSTGRGPRYVRIELEAGGLTSVVHEERIGAPAQHESLEFVLSLGDDQPDDVAVIVTVEAPHTESVTSRHPILLVGPERLFWED